MNSSTNFSKSSKINIQTFNFKKAFKFCTTMLVISLCSGQSTTNRDTKFYTDFLIDFFLYRHWGNVRLIVSGSSDIICDTYPEVFAISKASTNITCSSTTNWKVFEADTVPIILFDLEENSEEHFNESIYFIASVIKSNIYRQPFLYLSLSESPQKICESLEKVELLKPLNYKLTTTVLKGDVDSLEIYDIYGFATSPKPLLQATGNWTGRNGLELNSANDSRAVSFEGHLLRVTTVAGPPFVILSKDSSGQLIGTGYLPDLWNLMSEVINFNYTLETPSDGAFGNDDGKGNWSGMVGQLQRNEVDVALMSFSLTKTRKVVMDFSPPVEYSSTRLLIRRDWSTGELRWTAFLRPFHYNVWLSLLTLILFGSLTLTLVSRLRYLNFSPFNSIWLISTCFVNQGHSDHDTSPLLSFRAVTGSFWLLAVFTFASYTARLTSFLAADNERLPLKDLAEAVHSSAWKVGLVKGSSFVEKVKESKQEEMQTLWKNLNKDPSAFVSGFSEGIGRVYKERFLYFTSDLIPTYIVKGNCSYAWLPGQYFPGFGYMGYQKGLPYENSISHSLQKVRQVGLLRRTFKKWWGEQNSCGGSSDVFPAVGMLEVGSAFVFLAGGMLLAVIFTSWEYLKNFKRSSQVEPFVETESMYTYW